MLNGKFFTGLPPKMIERGGGGGATPNRLESHFYWPDDSKSETAAEIRLRRRNSVQLQENDKPVYGKQHTVGGGGNDVDTKRRFSKEFSQSSIQFYDNLNENNSTPNRRPLLRSMGTKRSELTEKPTATRVELPESIVDEAYTTAKRKQAYMSKIEFYDFVNEQAAAKTNQNNLRKPKMDMNDKREMELNSKNSPKLQMKRDVRSLSEEKEIPKINNRDAKTLERPRPVKELNVSRTSSMRGNNREEIHRRSNVNPKRSIGSARPSYERERDRYAHERDIEEEREGGILKRASMKPESFHKPRYASEREIYNKVHNTVLQREDDADYTSYNREPEVYDNRRCSQGRRYEEDAAEELEYRRVRNDTKTSSRSQYVSREDAREYDNNNYEEEIGSRMKTVRIHSSPPRKHHYYREEYYEDEDYQHNRTPPPPPLPKREPIKRETIQRRSDYSANEQYENDVLPYEDNIEIMNNNSNRSNRSSGGINKAHINRVTNKLNNEVDTGRDTSPPPGRSQSAAAAVTETAPIDVNKPRKHLRSSLCFHDGAIVAENDATLSPTSEKSATRRNIRNMATKRVSVGLPD